MSSRSNVHRRHRRPIAILLDRSRDLLSGTHLVRLEPDDIYHTTDSRVPLRAGRLARYDVLVIAGHAPATYSRRELDAIVGEKHRASLKIDRGRVTVPPRLPRRHHAGRQRRDDHENRHRHADAL